MTTTAPLSQDTIGHAAVPVPTFSGDHGVSELLGRATPLTMKLNSKGYQIGKSG